MSKLIVDGELMLYGPVGFTDFWDESGFTSSQVIEALVALSGDIVVRLNSGGGIAMEGSAIHNALKRHDGRVIVKIDAIAASAASLIAMAGDEIEMPLGTLLMIHEPSGMTLGPADDHRRAMPRSRNDDRRVCASLCRAHRPFRKRNSPDDEG
ncbi:Clp protease ClpP [Rhizobium leguminosarum bv. viciae]|uniref:Clp protease ClpP n=1 Tax=Rhizobium leguminosarum bv. viciae TaxID=387 RepID=A0A7G6RJH3_RHILV|nr:Clp protease ClpP [Rhizobium leguminosarum bv. viciae]